MRLSQRHLSVRRADASSGNVKLTGLPAIFDCFIVAADSVQRYALHHKRQPAQRIARVERKRSAVM